jgi:hypothetical protein
MFTLPSISALDQHKK